jgi:glutamate synthase domain-containing protein 3
MKHFIRGFEKRAKEHLVGGKADGMPDEAFDKKEVEEGVKIEREHTKDKEKAKEIAQDHLAETGKVRDGKIHSPYYGQLHEFEQKVKRES